MSANEAQPNRLDDFNSLKSILPDWDPTVLATIFQANDYSLELSIQTALSMQEEEGKPVSNKITSEKEVLNTSTSSPPPTAISAEIISVPEIGKNTAKNVDDGDEKRSNRYRGATFELPEEFLRRPGWNKGIDADTQLAMSLQREIILEAREKAKQPSLREQFSAVSSGIFSSISTTSIGTQNKGQNQINAPASSSEPSQQDAPKVSERSELPELPDLGLFKAMSIFGETAKKNLGTFGESTKKNLDSFSETAKKNLDSLVSTVSTASVSVSNTVASSARTASIRLTGVANDSGKAAIGVKESDSDLFNNSPSNGGGSPHTSNASSLSSNKISITPPTIPNKFSSKVSKKAGDDDDLEDVWGDDLADEPTPSDFKSSPTQFHRL